MYKKLKEESEKKILTEEKYMKMFYSESAFSVPIKHE